MASTSRIQRCIAFYVLEHRVFFLTMSHCFPKAVGRAKISAIFFFSKLTQLDICCRAKSFEQLLFLNLYSKSLRLRTTSFKRDPSPLFLSLSRAIIPLLLDLRPIGLKFRNVLGKPFQTIYSFLYFRTKKNSRKNRLGVPLGRIFSKYFFFVKAYKRIHFWKGLFKTNSELKSDLKSADLQGSYRPLKVTQGR